MRITIMDYGVGNLHSIAKGLERTGARIEVTTDAHALLGAECIVFPGVGAFGAAMEVLRPVLQELRSAILSGVPTLGICLGMQILFEGSDESPGPGIAAFKGCVKRLRGPRAPQMGWNDVQFGDDPLFDGIPDSSQFYFANSYVCQPSQRSAIVAESSYGESFIAAVRMGRLCGVQFHPEKSDIPGLRLLSNFV